MKDLKNVMKQVTMEQTDLMLTTLGYNFPNFTSDKFVTSRNCYFTHSTEDKKSDVEEAFDALAELGLAEKNPRGAEFSEYRLTSDGIDAVSAILRTEIVVLNVA